MTVAAATTSSETTQHASVRGGQDRLPRLLLHAEGAAVAVAAIALYFYADYAWWPLVLLVLVPDLSLGGYLAGRQVGSAIYNAAHTYVPAVGLGAIGVIAGADVAVQLALIWITHIGVDRAIGYGLKYPTSFNETHLQRAGRPNEDAHPIGAIRRREPARHAHPLAPRESRQSAGTAGSTNRRLIGGREVF
jgi:Domain of unknown function (DUF4260)